MTTIDFVELQGDLMPWSVVVELSTWSRWGHVAFELSDGTLMDAMPKNGVSIRKRGRDFYKWKKRFDLTKKFTYEQRKEMFYRGFAEIGQPYDWSWIVGYAVNKRNWQEEDSWVCFEYVAWTLMPWIEPEKNLSRITGRHLERMLKGVC